MWLPNAILDEVRAHEARVFYLSYAACRRWALVALKASLPADRGAALLRQLLDFGLISSA
jgi:hypothetical protein